MQDETTNTNPLRIAKVAAPVRAEVVQKLRQAILERHFAVGDRLIERELCEVTGVSRTSIREALRQLEAEGLVTNVPHRGMVVAGVSRKEAVDIYFVRELLEAAAARLFVANAGEASVAALRSAVDEFQRAAVDADMPAQLAAKARFYDTLVGTADNGIIASTLNSLHARVTALRATSMADPDRPAVSAQEMRAIVDAIARRDADAAAEACAFHIRQAAQCALSRMAAESEVDDRSTT